MKLLSNFLQFLLQIYDVENINVALEFSANNGA